MNSNTTSNMEFNTLLMEAVNLLTPLQLKVYRLHLLGWMNEEIADELSVKLEDIAVILFKARRCIKEFFQDKDKYTSKKVHQELTSLQQQDINLLTQTLLSERSDAVGGTQVPQDEESETLIKLGKIKDASIKASQVHKSLFVTAEFLSLNLPEEYQEELIEQLEEYQAAREGMKKSASTDTNFEDLWRKAVARASQRSLLTQENEAGYLETLDMAAEDTSREEELETWIKEEFTDAEVIFRDYTGRFLYKDLNSTILILRKGDDRATDLDGCVIDLIVSDQVEKKLEIEYGSVVIDFGDLELPIENYAEIRYVIRRNAEIIDQGMVNE